MATKNQEKKGLTRAQKTEATKVIIKELLAIKPTRHNELIDEAAKLYVSRHEGEDTENVNDVKGRVGSVLDTMKKESAVMYDGGMYALKARLPMPPPEVKPAETAEEKPVKKAKSPRAKKADKPAIEEVKLTETKEETPVKKTRGRGKKAESKGEEATEAAITESIEKKAEEKTEEKPAPKKRGRKPKAAQPVEEQPAEGKEEGKAEVVATAKEEQKAEVLPEKTEAPKVEASEKKEETPAPKAELIIKPVTDVAKQSVVRDMSILLGDKVMKTEKKPVVESKPAPKSETTAQVKVEAKPAPEKRTEDKREETKPAPKTEKADAKGEEKPTVKPQTKVEKRPTREVRARKTEKPLTADEKLRDAFLKKMYALGGDYFEYYSVYLLEKYSRRNGRRLEGLRISGGDHDGGIDGEIELTDKLGFKETIYIQSKNWNPEKGKEENWVVGETLLQQFIGACVCRQAKDGKQNARGIFITTSRFTPDAKRILEDMSDKIVGYDGNDLYETAKECEFGVVKRNGEWILDEKLLAGTKAFFNML